MEKIFRFGINRRNLLAALTSVLGALAVSTAAAQDQDAAKIDDKSDVMATGNIAWPGQKLGPAIKIYADHSVKFADGRPVPEGVFPSVIGKAANEVWKGVLGLSSLHLNKRGEAIHVTTNVNLAQFEAVAEAAMEANPAFAAAKLEARQHKVAKPVVPEAKPQIEQIDMEILGAEERRAQNVAASTAVVGKPAPPAPAVLAPVTQNTWPKWLQTAKDRFAQISEFIVCFLGLAAFTIGPKKGKGEDANSEDANSDDFFPDYDSRDTGLDGSNLPLPSSVAKAFGLMDDAWEPVAQDDLTSEGLSSQLSAPAAATATVASFAAVLDRAVNGDLATKLDDTSIENQDRGRKTMISRDEEGVIHVSLSKNRLRLEIVRNDDGSYAVKAAGAGLGRGKAPVAATLDVNGKLVIDQQTLAARMSAKQTKGNGTEAEFARAAIETFGIKAETVITSALTRAVAVLQAAPEPAPAIVRHGHRAAAIVRYARTASPKV